MRESRPIPLSQWAIALGLFALAVVFYARALGFDFVSWDDPLYVLGRPWERGLLALFSQPVSGGILPVHQFSYAFDAVFFGTEPWGYHLHSLLLNALNGVLAFALLLRISRNEQVSAAAALMFVVHPSHVSPAVWVSARGELLWFSFLLLSCLAYLRARREHGVLDRRFYLASLACFLLAVAAETTAAWYLLFFVALDYYEDQRLAPEQRRSLQQHALTKLPYLALAAPLLFVNAWVWTPSSDPWTRDLFASVMIKGQAAWRGLWVTIGLLPGQPLYDLPPVSRQPGLVLGTLIPLVIAPALWVAAIRRGHPNAALALTFCLVGLLPATLFPLEEVISDRNLYGPSLGFCWLLAGGFAYLARRMLSSKPLQVLALVLLMALPTLQFARNAWAYMPVWSDNLSLWSFADRFSDDPKVATQLSAALIREERFEEAISVLEEAPRRDVLGELYLATAYLEVDQFESANEASSRAITLARLGPAPSDTTVLRILWIHGVTLARLGDLEKARESWQLGLQIAPDFAPILQSLANTDPNRLAPKPAEPGAEAAPALESPAG